MPLVIKDTKSTNEIDKKENKDDNMKKLCREDLTYYIEEYTGHTIKSNEIDYFLDVIISGIIDALLNGYSIPIEGFGTFYTAIAPEKEIYHPPSGGKVLFPARHMPKFKPSRSFINLIKKTLDNTKG